MHWLDSFTLMLRRTRSPQRSLSLRPRCKPRPRRVRPSLEHLERREVLSATAGFPNAVVSGGTNLTMDQAQGLSLVGSHNQAEVVGSIPANRADVNYFTFTLSADATVHLHTVGQGRNALASVLTLYADDTQDPFVQPIAQADGLSRGGNAALDMTLSAGTYCVAVSGAGDRYFHPFIADSGFVGGTGSYDLRISTTAPGAPAGPFTWISSQTKPDSTVQTAHDLPALIGGNLVQVTGVLGNDPTAAAAGFDPVNDVDVYHFRITQPGHYAFAAEAFAGRINSTLNAALSLFRVGDNGSLVVVASNTDSGNGQGTTIPGPQPLFQDPALFVGLTQGNYYLAVSSGFNVPDPSADPTQPNPNVFDPTTAHTGNAGDSTGPYVLNVKLEKAPTRPHVVSTSLVAGATLQGPPAQLAVRFDAPMNLQAIAAQNYQTTGASTVPSVYVVGGDGNPVFPRFLSFDTATNTAFFQFLSPLPPGQATLLLSGGLGSVPALTDMAGDSTTGNDPSGDYVVPFRVAGPARATPVNPTAWVGGQSSDPGHPQVLGALFPVELAAGVTITRGNAPAASAPGDYYQIAVEQTQQYNFTLTNPDGSPSSAVVHVWQGNAEMPTFSFQAGLFVSNLAPGTYRVSVEWPDPASRGPYTLTVSTFGSAEPATSLTTGPAPALQLRLVADPPTPAAPVPATPGADAGIVAAGLADAGTPSGTSTFPLGAIPQGTFLTLSDQPLGNSGAAGSVGRPLLGDSFTVFGPNLFSKNALLLFVITTTQPPTGEAADPGFSDASSQLQVPPQPQPVHPGLALRQQDAVAPERIAHAPQVEAPENTTTLDDLFAAWPGRQGETSVSATESLPNPGTASLPVVAVASVPEDSSRATRAGEGWYRDSGMWQVGAVSLCALFTLVRARTAMTEGRNKQADRATPTLES